MQYITQCPHYSPLITRGFHEDNYLLSRLLKSSRLSLRFREESPISAACREADCCSLDVCGADAGGANRDRTDDLLLAKQALSQLSYGPAVLLVLGGGSGWIRTIDPRLIKTVL
jgi:hypothetical protein